MMITKLSIFEDFTLALRAISDKSVEVEKTVTFTATVTDSSIKDLVFSLNNEPSGATIDSKTGKVFLDTTKISWKYSRCSL